jgi:signal transduction histidine kinase
MVANPSKTNIIGDWLLNRRWLWVMLSLLSARSRELAWGAGCHHVQQRLQIRLNGAQSYDELAEVLLEFFRGALHLESAAVLVYDPRARSFRPLRTWSPRGKPEVKPSPTLSDWYFFPFILNGSPVGAAQFIFPPGIQPFLQQARLLGDLAPTIASAFQRVQLEEQLKRRAEIFDAEQQRIARDVHDTLGHSLVHVRLMLDHILLDLNHAEKTALRCEVESLQQVVKEAYGQMRDVLAALTPDDDSDLVPRLQDFADKIRPRAGYRLQIRSFGQPRRLPPYLHRHIFFIFREALTNIDKHACAGQVEVELCWQATCLEITITDDGVGFDTSTVIDQGHFGLKNIRQRALETGARLEISSQPGRGARILLSFPYASGV